MLNKISKFSGKVILFFCLFLLYGCKANLEWFVRNHTDKEVTLTLRYETKKEKYRPDFIPLKPKYVYFKREIVPINYETTYLMEDSLPIASLSDSCYQIILPARSTIELTYIVPTDYNYLPNVIAEFQQQGSLYAINTKDVFGKRSVFKTAGGFSLKNLVYYDYGKPKK
jgi:hypothetical protein